MVSIKFVVEMKKKHFLDIGHMPGRAIEPSTFPIKMKLQTLTNKSFFEEKRDEADLSEGELDLVSYRANISKAYF